MPGPSRSSRRTQRGPGRPSASRSARSRGSVTPARETKRSTTPDLGDKITRGLTFTRRAFILIAVLAVLALSYANSLRVYFAQKQEIAAQRVRVEALSAQISNLEKTLDAWKDPDYVRTQARQRLGWISPSDTGYVVIGADGKPVVGSSAVAQGLGSETRSRMAWWQKVTDTIAVADKPGPKQPTAAPTKKPNR